MKLSTIVLAIVAMIGCGNRLEADQGPKSSQKDSLATYNLAYLGIFQLIAADESRLLIAQERPGSAEIVSYDLKSGKTTALTLVNDKLRDDHVASLYDARIRVSDGAKRFAWARYPFSTGFRVIGVDGKLDRVIDSEMPQELSFEPGSSSLVVLGGHGFLPAEKLIIYDIDRDATMAAIELSNSPFAGTTNELGHPFVPCFHLEGEDRAIVLEHYIYGPVNPMLRRASARYAILAEHRLLVPNGNAIRTFKCNLPARSDLIRAFVSPGESQVLWELGFEHTTELWASSLDGVGLHSIFSIPYDSAKVSASPEPPITDVTWLPNNHGVAWRAGGAVYVRHSL